MMTRSLILIVALMLGGCSTYNPYTQPHFDWSGVPGLAPLDYRKPPDPGKMCLGPFG